MHVAEATSIVAEATNINSILTSECHLHVLALTRTVTRIFETLTTNVSRSASRGRQACCLLPHDTQHACRVWVVGTLPLPKQCPMCLNRMLGAAEPD